MSEPLQTEAKPYPFSVMSVLGTAMRVTKKNFVPFLVLACVLEIPALAVQLASGGDVALGMILDLLTRSLTSAVVAYGVIMELHGSRPSTAACIATGFSQLGRVLGVSIVSGLAIVAATLALIVPGVIVALMFYVIVPVTIVERLGIDDAMKRSRELTAGRKGDLFLLFVLGAAVGIGVELSAPHDLGIYAVTVWRGLGTALVTMFFSVTTAVAYVQLRQLREGTQVPELASAVARIRK